MTILIKQTPFKPIPTGKYLAKIAEIKESDQFGPQLLITFELPEDDEGVTRTLMGWTTQKFYPISKLYEWTKAIFGGGPIDREYTFNSDDLIGMPVYINVVVEESEIGPYNTISNLSPYKKEKNQSSPPRDFEGDW